jgi:hypothetical protein
LKNPFSSKDEISTIDLQSSVIKPLLPFIITFLGIQTIGFFLILRDREFAFSDVGRILMVVTYFGAIGSATVLLVVVRALETEQGNQRACLKATIRWALGQTTAELELFFQGVQPIDKIKCDIKNTDVYQLLQKYKTRLGLISEEKEEQKKEKDEKKDPEEKEEQKKEKDFIFVDKIRLAGQKIGYDEQARIERIFQSIYIHAPGAPFTKHFPQQDIIEVPYGFAIIKHGHADTPHFDCIGWTQDPASGEWVPHFFPTSSVWHSIALRKNIKLPTTNESIIAYSYIKDLGDLALGIYSDWQVAEQQVNDLMNRRPKKASDYATRERDADHKEESTIFQPESEEKPSYWKVILTLGCVALAIAFITRLAGLW